MSYEVGDKIELDIEIHRKHHWYMIGDINIQEIFEINPNIVQKEKLPVRMFCTIKHRRKEVGNYFSYILTVQMIDFKTDEVGFYAPMLEEFVTNDLVLEKMIERTENEYNNTR